MSRKVATAVCAAAFFCFSACGSPPGALQARLHWPENRLRAAPSAVDELRFVVRGGEGFERRAAVPAAVGAWQSPPLAAGRYRLEAVALADGQALLRAVTEVSVNSDRISRVDLQMEQLR